MSVNPITQKNRYVILLLNFFILAIIILAIALLPLYYFMVDILKQGQHESNEFILHQIKTNVDSSLKQIDKIASRIIINPILINISFKNYCNLYNSLEEYTNDVNKLRQILRNEKVNYPYIHSIYLYLPKSDIVLADGVLFHLDDFNDKEFIYGILKNSNMNGWSGPRAITRKSMAISAIHPGQVITLYRKSLISGQKDASMMIAINIDINALNEVVFSSNKYKDLQFLMTNSEGFILISYNSMPIGNIKDAGIDLAHSGKGTKFWEQSVNGEAMLISHIMSTYNGWRYLVLLPKSTVIKPLIMVKQCLIFTIIACFFISLFLAFSMSRKYYKPIANLVRGIVHPSDYNGNKDDFELLNSTFQNLLDENENNKHIIEENWNLIKDKHVLDILKGYKPSFNVHDNLDMGYHLFRVLCLERDDIHRLEKTNSEIDKSLALYNMESICVETCNLYIEKHVALTTKVSDSLLAIVLNYEDTIDNRAFTLFVKHLKKNILDQLGISCTIGVGKIYSSQNYIKQSYKEAQNALKWRVFMGPNHIINFEDKTFDWSQYDETEIINKKELLLETIKIKDKDKVCTIIGEIGSTMSYISPRYFNRIKFLFVTICQDVTKLLYITTGDDKSILDELFDIYNMIEYARCINDLILILKKVSLNTINYLEEKTKQINNEMVMNILSYIQQHFHEDFSIEFLAERTKHHPIYLGKLIKETTGKTFPQYITSLRMEEAKRLLNDTDQNIKEIYEKLGYTNRQSFLRAFKSETGLTPTEFRKLNIQINLKSQ